MYARVKSALSLPACGIQSGRETKIFGICFHTDSTFRLQRHPHHTIGQDFDIRTPHPLSLFVGRNRFKSFSLLVETESMIVIGQYPDIIIWVYLHDIHTIVGQSYFIALASLVDFKIITIKLIYTVPSREPQNAIIILNHAHNGILRQSILRRIMSKNTIGLGIRIQCQKGQCQNQEQVFFHVTDTQ